MSYKSCLQQQRERGDARNNSVDLLNAEQCLTRKHKRFAFIHSNVDYAQMQSISIAIIVDNQCVGRCWRDPTWAQPKLSSSPLPPPAIS